ncbi:MAG: thiamine pyrophosphate-dependent enzyme [Chloroflexota bacterium]
MTMDCVKALEILARRRRDEVVVNTMVPSRVWPEFSTNPDLDIPFIGCMGKASSLGLGIALGRPDKNVWVFDGDGSLLMNLGSLVTIANAGPRNLVHFVFENGVYEITGSQPIPGEGKFDLVGLARSAGISRVYEFANLAALEDGLDQVLAGEGPVFVNLRVGQVSQIGAKPPRLMGAAARHVRAVLAGG